ncbi:hypothetical protein HPG69_004164, partial [Diceros bicornis minor]
QHLFGSLNYGIHTWCLGKRIDWNNELYLLASHIETNKTWKINMYETQTIIFLVLLSVEITMPVTISIASLLLLLLSLWRHIKRMNFNITGSQDPSSEAHGKAMRMVTCFFFLFLISIVLILIIVYSHVLSPNRLMWTFSKLITSAHPLGHSFI